MKLTKKQELFSQSIEIIKLATNKNYNDETDIDFQIDALNSMQENIKRVTNYVVFNDIPVTVKYRSKYMGNIESFIDQCGVLIGMAEDGILDSFSAVSYDELNITYKPSNIIYNLDKISLAVLNSCNAY